ncbi:GH92 family glycosyl hydrolase [Amycolatopsis jiangsuensis]|uniref:Putative alpha-1,2-mannosidase n=1 Tax=Amycolatopsis jiangsuensis TaxID=1181879 RepID=A0A840J656_9PSEU|nr:GH92 family glycosyl hydrolase [Amycolatopsis jiangsuensis]MBB4689263.1 putative alpha-1,2-mannosidase [Amycolatopsis jiangsuensis]
MRSAAVRHSSAARWGTVVLSVALVAAGVLAGTGVSAGAATGSVPGAGADLTKLVNPFIGTENEGLDFPAAGAPFGLVQESPLMKTAGGTGCDTESADTVTGFSQTTINGCRFNYLPMMPTTGAVTSTDPAQYASTFSHAKETTGPDYYRTELDKYGVTVGLTATARTGWQQYTFPRTSRANVLFSAGAGVTRSEIRVVGDRTVEGWVEDSKKTYFVAQLSRPFASYGTWRGSDRAPGSRESAAKGSNGAWVTFDTTKDDAPVVAKVGLSFTGLDGARKNLSTETGKLGFDFDAAHKALHDQWNTMLHKAAVGGGSHDQRVAYYTALYHSMLDPNLIGDVDGRYVGADKKIHTARGYTPYSNFSLWDTYRTQNQLLEMLVPKVAHDIDMSLLAIAREGGALPRWYLEDQEGNIMTGDPVTPFLVEGWSKGLLTGADAEEAYKYLRATATEVPSAGVRQNGRAGVAYYAERGYVPYGLNITSNDNCASGGTSGACCPTKGNDNDCYYGTSATLEYAAADASLALMAKGLGHASDATMFAKRGQSYKNVFDTRTGQFRPRTAADGTWLTPYDPVTSNHAFHEQNSSQYQWMVPQDPAGLVSMLGGRGTTTARLNEFFAYDDLLADPEGTAREAWVSDPYNYYDSTKYNPNNEPNLIAPYLYAWTGQPGHTATVVKAQETLFTNTPGGIPGNDDMGEMSSWYVMSSLGLYPTTSGANFDVLTTPQFPAARVRIGDYGKTQGGTLTISAPGTSMINRYIASATVNGTAWGKAWVDQADIAHGGRIDYALSTKPTAWATAAKDAPPSIDRTPNPQHQLNVDVTPDQVSLEPTAGRASQQDVELTLLATAPRNARIAVTAKGPKGWLVVPSSAVSTARSNGLPAQVNDTVRITAPAGTTAGTYPVSVTAKLPGAAPVTKTVTVVVQQAGSCAIQTDTSCAVDLNAAYNNDGVATLDAPGEGDFDGTGVSYAADQLPAPGPVTFGDVTYQAPPTSGSSPNFVKSTGQALALPSGHYGSLHIVGASDNGSTGAASATAVVTYTDGSAATVPLQLTGWANTAPDFGNTVALTTAYQLKAGTGKVDNKASLYETTVPLEPGKQVRSLSLTAPSVPAWVAPGSGGLDWQRNSDLEIYAMTLQR